MNKQKVSQWLWWIFILSLLLVSCQLSPPGHVEDIRARDLAWQALVEEYQPDEIADGTTLGPCRRGQVLRLDAVNVPELEGLFPGIRLFLGGLTFSCLPGPMPGEASELDLIPGTYKFMAVYQGQVYFLVPSMRRTQGHENYVDFNRLLRRTGQEVTPDNEEKVAKASSAMVMFSHYADFFDPDMWHEGLQPAEYRFGEFQMIDEYEEFVDEHFTRAWATWIAHKGQVTKWQLAFSNGLPSYVAGKCVLSKVSFDDFEKKPFEALEGSADYCEAGGGGAIAQPDLE